MREEGFYMDLCTAPPSKRIEQMVDEVKKQTQTQAYSLTIQPNRRPALTDSKLGGLPYWDLSKPYPTDPEGSPLDLWAQINFDNTTVEEPLPQHGMLQFFIGRNDMFGLNFDSPDVQEYFRVVYHETIDPSVTLEQIQALGVVDPTQSEPGNTPLTGEYAIEVSKKTSYMGPCSYTFEHLILPIVHQICGKQMDIDEYYSFFDDDELEYMDEVMASTGHQMLGYPYFTQGDPREQAHYQRYDTLLLQIDSEMGEDRRDYVLWGDCGVANFFIGLDDLKNRDFSRVFYTWDCC